MRPITDEEKLAVLNFIEGVGLIAIIDTVRESHQQRADMAEMEAQAMTSSEKFRESEEWKASALALSQAVVTLKESAFRDESPEL